MILLRQANAVRTPPIPGVVLRPPAVEDTHALAHLYYESYEPGVASATPEEAQEDITLTFEGATAYSPRTSAASPGKTISSWAHCW